MKIFPIQSPIWLHKKLTKYYCKTIFKMKIFTNPVANMVATFKTIAKLCLKQKQKNC